MATYLGAGSKFYLGSNDNPATAVFTLIPQITSATRDAAKDELEVTNLSSTTKEYRPGLADAPTMTLSINYDHNEATHDHRTGLLALSRADTQRLLKIEPNGATQSETWLINVLGTSQPFSPNEVQTFEVNIRASGAPTYADIA
jgi:hypothetical protein